ncbi:MAG: M56 family metallopeptidase [Peptostreptococcaceae bacterium]|nr:M56 family metallopeptidase [Peptostreptococcaceae bacterium]
MDFALILSNSFFCGIAIILLFPLFRHPKFLTCWKGIPFFTILLACLAKLVIPVEFEFTKVLPSEKILTTIRTLEYTEITNGLTVQTALFFTTFVLTICFILCSVYDYRKFKKELDAIPPAKDGMLDEILLTLCEEKNIAEIPKLIKTSENIPPFIIGLRHPVIVLPDDLSYEEIRFVLLHELEHLRNQHFILKHLVEVLSIIFWWNPVMWSLRGEISRAIEVQADTYALQNCSDDERIEYVTTLLNISQRTKSPKRPILSSSFFSDKSDGIRYRMASILRFDEGGENGIRTLIVPLLLSVLFFGLSFCYTFNAYYTNSPETAGTFAISRNNAYFLNIDNQYHLYVDGKKLSTMEKIPDDFSYLAVYDAHPSGKNVFFETIESLLNP